VIETTGKPVAVVTGAAHGSGYELALQFAQHGFDLVITADGPGVDDTAQACRAIGATVVAVQADLGSADGVETLYAAIEATGRAVDVLVLNAGIETGGAARVATRVATRQDGTTLINRNVGLVRLAKLVVQDMVSRGGGRLVLTSSDAARLPGVSDAVDAASMAFVDTFATSLRNHLKPTDVVVTVLQPGSTDPGIFRTPGTSDCTAGAARKTSWLTCSSSA